MQFWLKKFVAFWLMPVPLSLTLLVTGWWLTRRAHSGRLGRLLLTAGIALLLLFSNKFVSTQLLLPFENRYPAVPEAAEGRALPAGLAACQYIAVLGGGHSDTPGLSAANQLSPAALSRLSEALRIARLLPQARLILSGPALPGNPSHASVLARAAVDLGFDPRRIKLVENARDTEEEAQAIRALVGDSRVALVTSAAHLPRAAALFRKAGTSVFPCPADYTARPPRNFHWNDLSWDAPSLSRSTTAVYEFVGTVWLRLRRQID